MSEITKSILEGEVCHICGCWMEDFLEDGYGCGYPQTCPDCQEEDSEECIDDTEDY